jgi:hypothetical protein
VRGPRERVGYEVGEASPTYGIAFGEAQRSTGLVDCDEPCDRVAGEACDELVDGGGSSGGGIL